MAGLYGSFDVAVAGAGVTGVIAAVSAARAGARTLVVEGTGFIGGNVTAGRLTKPTGVVEAGIFHELMARTAALGGADIATRTTEWGAFTGVFDPETMLRAMIEMLEEAAVEVLLHATITGTVADDAVRGLELHVKSGRTLVLAKALVDASGDGDVAAFAGARFAVGRPSDDKTQPISCYVRMLGADTPALARYIAENRNEFTSVVLPEEPGATPEHYVFRLLASGFGSLIEAGRAAGAWTLPKNYLTIKTGLLPGELNLNITRVQGDALDERTLSRAEIEIRKQAYEAVDFVRRYIPGCGNAVLLDIAPKIGVRETRRIVGDYVLTGEDVGDGRRFADSIGLAKAPIDIHEPGGEGGGIARMAEAYDVPYRCLLPAGIEGLLIAGRCISVDAIAFGSTRNIPVCAITGEAAGVAAALAAAKGTTPRDLGPEPVQRELRRRGLPFGELVEAA